MPVALSRFPALVQTPEGSHDRAAYIVTEDQATVYVLAAGAVTVAARKEGTASTRQEGQYRVLVFADGTEWRDSKGRGCGCGSPLKRWYATHQPRRVGT